VKAYFDSNLLVAAFIREHPHHGPASDLVNLTQGESVKGCVSNHGLAEFYGVLTRAPYSPRVHPMEAKGFLEDFVYPYFEIVALGETDYRTVIANIANAGLAGGIIYDALHLWAAQKANCDRIYTFNVRHFRMLASEEQARKITSP
jgi:predicted nucleic acid-binding protein